MSLRCAPSLACLSFFSSRGLLFTFIFVIFYNKYLVFWRCPVSALSRVSGFVPSVRSVVRSARFRCAPWGFSALGLSVRPSARSLSGAVAVVRFRSRVGAAAFARCWARRLPMACRGCAVRTASGFWFVSVPVAPALGSR